ncbi:MAG: adenylate/guanylate cyclase domain-containing protein [Acidimicrobiia bacterium]|nr:adenylate/guanylate cyclase domain-containing protein [Acidimicrobiia bacterium]
MRCDSCGTENREARRFCRECGAALTITCAGCDAANEGGDKFCGSCGAALGAPAARAVDAPEMRLVSVLFADLVGFTTLAEDHHPEEVREILTAYFDRARSIIERHGGSVEKYIGDAVMGMWGTTQVREDDAERAVRAASELVEMAQGLGSDVGISELALRAGVNTGIASVGAGGNATGMVVGDLVNVAARLQALADPGSVYVGVGTRDATVGTITCRSLGEMAVKGKADPVLVFRAAPDAADESAAAEIREPPFVNRERERRLLHDTLAEVRDGGRAHLVSIVGEAGVGKSRLAAEFFADLERSSDHVYGHTGRCPSYGDGVTFWALGEMVRRRCGIREGERDAHARSRLLTTVAEYVANSDDHAFVEPRLAGLLGLEEMPPGGRPELFSALRLFFQHLADRLPTVLLFEDLHWADRGMLEFISELVERSPRSPILVVTLARPDLLERAPDWAQLRSMTSLRLGPLADADVTALLHAYIPGVDGRLVDRLAERAGGIPMYAVEMVRGLASSGHLRRIGDAYEFTGDHESDVLPESLHAVIGARLDRLDDADRMLLQDAAVLGQTFTLDAVCALRGGGREGIEAGLERLMRQEILDVVGDPRSPERGQYTFVQSLIREVAYRRLGRKAARSRHLAAAEYYAGRHDPELAPVVAGHYMVAYEESSADAGRAALADRPLLALTDAAVRAAALHSNEQAMDLYDQAIAMCDDAALRAKMQLDATRPAAWAAATDRGLAYARAAQRYYAGCGDTPGFRAAVARESDLLNRSYQSDSALALVEPVYGEVGDVLDAADVAVVAEAARALMLVGRHGEALEAIDRLLEPAERLGETEILLESLTTKASVLGLDGRLVEARALFEGVITRAEAAGLLSTALRALGNLMALTQFSATSGEIERSNARYRELAERAGDASLDDSVAGEAIWFSVSGRYAETQSIIDRYEHEGMAAQPAAVLELARHFLAWLRDGDHAALDAAKAVVARFDEVTETQGRDLWDMLRAGLHNEAGEWEEAFESAMRTKLIFANDAVLQAAFAATWLRDADRIAQVAARFPDPYLIQPGLQRLVEAAQLGIDGEVDAAVEAFTEVIGMWEERDSPDTPFLQVMFSLLLREESELARDAGRAARDWLLEIGCPGRLEVWADAFPSVPGLADAVG